MNKFSDFRYHTKSAQKTLLAKKPEVPRAFHRYSTGPWGEEVELVLENNKLSAFVLDQSLAGLGLKVMEGAPVKVGQILTVANKSNQSKARLIFIRPLAGGLSKIGLMLI